MKYIVVLYVFLFHIKICSSNTHPYQHLKDNIRSSKTALYGSDVDNRDKGFMMCAGNHLIPDVLKMIWQLKHEWKSECSVAVAHCGEISEENHEVLKLMHPSIKILNVCATKTVFGMSQQQAHSRLRGFYCKVAAMILSPFPETMLLDLDVVWLQSPDSLFNSQAYAKTGALFFRDQTYLANAHHKSDDQFLLELFQSKNIGQTPEEIKQLAYSDGISFYWLHMAGELQSEKPFPELGDQQDSSVVLINSQKHPKLISLLAELISSFDYGDGDKEIFWIAATISQERFTLSPFLAGQYGDCHGVTLHFHPDDAEDASNARPLFINAAYLVEKDLPSVGTHVYALHTLPVLASAELAVDINMNTWPAGSKRGDSGCTCKHYPCGPVSSATSQRILYAQWLSMTMRLSRQGPQKDCVPVLTKEIADFALSLSALLSPEQCFFVGCPHLPVLVKTNVTWPSGRFCDPVHFLAAAPADLPELAAEARRPNSAYNMPPTKDNTPIQCDMDKQLYLYISGTARPFNSWSAFVNRGFDLDNVVRIPKWQCDNIPPGEPLN
jgi:hypothetical protein